MDRPDEGRALGIIAEHTPELRHQTVQRDLRHEGLGPQLRVDVGLRDGARPPFEQDRQEIECLAREVTLDTVAPDPASRRIELDALGHRCPN